MNTWSILSSPLFSKGTAHYSNSAFFILEIGSNSQQPRNHTGAHTTGTLPCTSNLLRASLRRQTSSRAQGMVQNAALDYSLPYIMQWTETK